ncbi:hypothetical protein K504DRAFT_455513 [Pleomassaria siparia CBS 279.74]|uniref:Uncharacterized protein n=1 Tax=Pleomassaria siparia CBS 279.74 TaxID=1314801 RepID=A0A6G1K843_9PLEO|nr:hypothetical protein K504DRAFT_455513 [Pleomassaria siparia CBS 279.74]
MATNTNDAEEQVLAALCGDADPWTWGETGQCSFSFKRDGTGAAQRFETTCRTLHLRAKLLFPGAPLHSAAFRPKQYTVTLKRGRFIEPCDLFIKKPYPIFQSRQYRAAPNRYASQLVFEDMSPYPPREEWVEKGGLRPHLDYHRYWERREFVREIIARKDETWAEMLDLGWWLSPTIGDAHTRDI